MCHHKMTGSETLIIISIIMTVGLPVTRRKKMLVPIIGALKLFIKTAPDPVKPQAWLTFTTLIPRSTIRGTAVGVWMMPSHKNVSQKFPRDIRSLTVPQGALGCGITSLTTTRGRPRSSLANQKRYLEKS